MATCVNCGTEFTPTHPHNTRCKKTCQKKKTTYRSTTTARKRELHHLTFIGVDGEGVDLPDGDQAYALLSVGEKSLYHPDRKTRLTWREIFPFLYDQFLSNKRAVFVGFALGYDFNQWIRTLDRHAAKMLLTKDGIAARKPKTRINPVPFPVHVGDDDNPRQWEIDTLGLKRFKLRPGVPEGTKNNHPWMVICDAFAFFQMSFLRVLDQWSGDTLPEEDYDLITAGKLKRAEYQEYVTDDMITYNRSENRLLASVMKTLNQGLVSVGVRLKKDQWYGPGQAAQQWLNDHGCPTAETMNDLYKGSPFNPLDIAIKSYYGGWFETPLHGYIPGTTYEYDINSAYPSIIAKLPCLLHGEWKKVPTHDIQRRIPIRTNGMPNRYRIVRGIFIGTPDAAFGPMPHRYQGRVLRPRITSGWHWRHEVDASIDAGLCETALIKEAWDYVPCRCEPPLAAMETLYKQRLKVGKETPQGKAMKLIYNSAYGKLAQSIGHPKFANPIYASLITAGCRTDILRAIATHPEKSRAVAMVATDGVYFTAPHPALELSDTELGKWGMSVKENMTILMPGVYWDDKARKAESLTFKSRGVPARALKPFLDNIDAQWKSFDGKSWPSITVDIPFTYTTCLQALLGEDAKWYREAGRIHTDRVRTIDTTPDSKRSITRVHQDHGVWRSDVLHLSDTMWETQPYDCAMGVQGLEERASIMTPGHDTDDTLRSIIHALSGE